MKLILLTVLITLNLNSINTQVLPVPDQLIQLIKGVEEGLNLPERFGAVNCKDDINKIKELAGTIPADLINQNFINAFVSFSQITQQVTTIISKCPEIKDKMKENLSFLNNAYHAPGQFLHDGIDENIGWSGLKNLYYLLDELEEKDLTEAGRTLAKVMDKFGEFKLQGLQKNLLFLASKVKSEDPCLQILENLIADCKTMLKNIFSDINEVKRALDDFMAKIKTVPDVCIN